jgi:hypothetical protein
MLTADSNKKIVLCITDTFTKYAVVTSIQNKNAETVAHAIFKEWFCKFGIPAQIHTNSGKEFVNKFSAEMMELMNVSHTGELKRFLFSSPAVQFPSGSF